mmetsp:Transcript_32518/g.69253  ORF Transcript_32518/g.69253 Transcript_32518/m.69253 type:complete len:294 (-) Transcript_32518:160-1041(-)
MAGACGDSANDRIGRVSMGGDDAGDQGNSQTCGIFSLNNVIEDQLRCLHGISDYDPAAGAQIMREQNYTGSDGRPIEVSGTSMEGLIDQVNASIQGSMLLPTKDGRGVRFTLDCSFSCGANEAAPGDIVLARMYDGRGNHFMEVMSFDGTKIATQNSWSREMITSVPDDDDFEEAIGIYKITITDIRQDGEMSQSDAWPATEQTGAAAKWRQLSECVARDQLQVPLDDAAVFDFFDDDQTGSISVRNLMRAIEICGLCFTDDDVREMISEGDPTGDGVVDQDNFLRLLSEAGN